MKKTHNSKKSVNLLREPSSPKSFWEKFYTWSLTIGRYIIVGTEAVVLCVFIARFKLDRDINDLSDSLETKYSILETFKESEVNARSVQYLMNIASSLYETQPIKSNIYQELIALETPGTEINSFSIIDNELSIDALSENFEAFNTFENVYKGKDDLLYDVTISRTEKDGDKDTSQYEFSLRAKIKSSTEL